MPVPPWTMRLRGSFRQSLRYYERRFEILRAFEDSGDLYGFMVDEDENRVSVRLGDAYHWVAFTPYSFEAAVLAPTGEPDRVDAALTRIWEALELETVTSPSFSFQWVLPVEGDYDELRRTAAAQAWGLDSLRDFALLADGAMEDPPMTYRVEAGIVEAAELPRRFARLQGILEVPDPESPPGLWDPESLPATAVFADTLWQLEGRVEGVEELRGKRTVVEDAARQLVFGLMGKFGTEDFHE